MDYKSAVTDSNVECIMAPHLLWDGKPENRYKCHVGVTPPSIAPTWNSVIYPLGEDVQDKGKQYRPPVDQLTLANIKRLYEEEFEIRDNKFLNFAKMNRKFSGLSRYCPTCTEHPPSDWPTSHLKEGKIWSAKISKRWAPICHNHTSTRVRRALGGMDKFGRYQCLECGPTRAVHHIKQGVRHLVCVTSSCLNNWMTAQVNARQGFKGTDIHVDWEGISGGTVRDLAHAISAVYGESKYPLDVIVALGSNDITQGRHVNDIMRDLNRFKAMVLSIAPRHESGLSTFAVCTPPHPPAYTKYGIDDHFPGKKGRELYNRQFLELTESIVEFNLNSDKVAPGVKNAPMFHRYGVHHKKNTARDLYELTSIPSHHRYDEWREEEKEDMRHLAEHKRVQMGTAIVSYFKRLHGITVAN